MKLFFSLFIIALFSISLSSQTTRHVPAQYTTIQAGLNSAQTGDTVLVQPGTYYENIFWPNVNGIILIGVGDTSNTIIDGGQLSNVITFFSNGTIDTSTVIKGFKIVNGGNVSYGGGILMNGASPLLINIVLAFNTATISGSGIYAINNSDPELRYCVIRNNFGNGYYAQNNSDTKFIFCIIKNNSGRGFSASDSSHISFYSGTISCNQGGGISTSYSSGAEIVNTDIVGNYGATAFSSVVNCFPYISNVNFINNEGGALSISNDSIYIINSLFYNNSGQNGGAVNVEYNGKLHFNKVSFVKNYASQFGGAIYLESLSQNMKIEHCNFIGNYANNKGSSIYTVHALAASIINSNFFNNNHSVYNAENTGYFDTANNWWGNSNGPYHLIQNQNGYGDSVNIFVNILPYKIEADTEATPIQPQDVKVLASDSNSITLNWNSSPQSDIVGYKIYYDTQEKNLFYEYSIDVGNITTYQLGNLQSNTIYYLAVTSYDKGGNESCYSDRKISYTFNLGAAWIRTYGGKYYDYGRSVRQTNDGGYIVVGNKSFTVGNTDVWLIKIDSNGVAQWEKTIGNYEPEIAFAVEETSDSGYVICGVKAFGNYSKGLLLKTDHLGDTLWTKFYEFDNHNGGFISLNLTDDGGYIIVGATETNTTGNNDFWLVKTDMDGNIIWNKNIGGSSSDQGFSVQQTTDKGFIVAGYTASYGNGAGDYWLIKTDSSGDTLWTKTYGGLGPDVGRCVQQTKDGGYIISGEIRRSDGVGIDLWLIKTDSSGDSVWTIRYGGYYNADGYSVQETEDGGYIAAGSTTSSLYGDQDALLLRTNSLGDIIWTKTIGGIGSDEIYSIQQTHDLGYIMTGSTSSFGTEQYDLWLIKYDEGFMSDLSEERITFDRYKLMQNYPNPFNPSTTISYSLSNNSFVQLKIFNLLGQEVAVLVNEEKPIGNYEINFNASNLSSGVYFYKIQAGDFVQTKKMMLLK